MSDHTEKGFSKLGNSHKVKNILAELTINVNVMIELIVQVLILAISLIVLASASHFTIRSVEELIELTGLSEISAGFAILAVMTSTPEIIVAFFQFSKELLESV